MRFATTSVLAVGVLLSCVTTSMNAQAQTRAQREAEREQARFRTMDRDADGVITRGEWRGTAEAFARYDTNRDGVLSGSEIWIGGRRTDGPAVNSIPSTDRRRQDDLLESFYRAD